MRYIVLPPEWLLVFDYKELELLLCGIDEINVDDWKQHTALSVSLANSNIMVWFWDLVREMSNAERAKLLQFATGSTHVPVQGFKGLTSTDGRLCPFSINAIVYVRGALPRAHACFNRIELPLYPTREELVRALQTLLSMEIAEFTMVNTPVSTQLTHPLLRNEFLDAIQGLDRKEVEQLMENAEKWECTICNFLNAMDSSICVLCDNIKDCVLAPSNWTIKQLCASLRKDWRRTLDNEKIVWKQESSFKSTPENIFILVANSTGKGEIDLVCAPLDVSNAGYNMLGETLPIWYAEQLVELNKATFSVKYSWFLTTLAISFDSNHRMKLKLCRNKLYEESMMILQNLPAHQLCKTTRIVLLGEVGVDAGGLQREW
ncbi:HECT E3 ubiquitin ligase, partial [Thraustotheca clavata]